MKNIDDHLIRIVINEHTLKKRLLFANIQIIMEMISEPADAQMLIPTILDLINTSLKNDEMIIRLIELFKKHKATSNKFSDEDEDVSDTDDELLKLINEEPQEIQELNKFINNKLKNTGFDSEVK